MSIDEMLRQGRVPVAFGLLVSSWIALIAPVPVKLIVFTIAFLTLLFGFNARHRQQVWGSGLSFKTPTQSLLSLGFWATLLGAGAYRYLLGHDIDIAPTIVAISAMNYLPWPGDDRT